jgi:predicted CopG family antitoxin
MVKTLTIKNKVYEELVTIKGREESFSDLFERLAKKEKRGIMEFAGFLSKEEGNKVKKAISGYKKKSRKMDLEREKRLEKLWSS